MASSNKGEIRNGHELAPLNSRQGGEGGKPGVTIVLQGPRGSIVSRGSGAADGDPDRAAWSGKMQFFLSIIGYSVGLGNIWRFPYLCQQNGGGAFLIPFAVMLILEGIPLFLIELGIGQKMRLGSLGVWNTIHPWLGGIGISSCIVTFFVALYYNVIITWCFYYLFNSFQSPLPWAECPTLNGTIIEECEKASPTDYFWYRTTLDASPAIDQPGAPRWWIVVCLLLSWLIVFFIMMKGIQSSGKVVYFTSLFPYVVLTIFFIRGVTLHGASAGLAHMYTPKVEKLLEPTVWLDAATQVFYSFGLAFGSLIAFGSYNTPKNNCVRDVILVSVCNAITAIYASVVIFAILGFKAVAKVESCIEGNKHILVANGNLTLENKDTLYESIVEVALKNNMTGIHECSLENELNNQATCDPVNPQKLALMQIERGILDSIQELLSKIVAAVTSKIDEIIKLLQNSASTIMRDIQGFSEKATEQASKIVDASLDAINQVVKSVVDLGLDPKQCLGTVMETIAGFKDSYVKDLGKCATDRIPQLLTLLQEGITEVQKVNEEVKALGLELAACKEESFCLIKFFAKLTVKAVELPALIVKSGIKYTKEFAKISADTLTCTTGIVVELTKAVAGPTQTTVKCLLGLAQNQTTLIDGSEMF